MNGFGFVFSLASVLAVFSLPFVFLAILMKRVGRISSKRFVMVLLFELALWITAVFYWCHVAGNSHSTSLMSEIHQPVLASR
jgi:hypothetical protein